MAELLIRTIPDPVLRKKTTRVKVVDKSTKKLITDMLDTIHCVPGRVGLAAPQVGKSLRLCVIGIPDENEKGNGHTRDYVLINPEIVRKKGERVVQEGCLSIPGYVGEITRAEVVTVKYRDLSGKEVRLKAEDLLAQAVEHEVDHLNGVLYIDHLESQEKLYKIQPQDIEGGALEDGTGNEEKD